VCVRLFTVALYTRITQPSEISCLSNDTGYISTTMVYNNNKFPEVNLICLITKTSITIGMQGGGRGAGREGEGGVSLCHGAPVR
jgi:hypothetical protein